MLSCSRSCMKRFLTPKDGAAPAQEEKKLKGDVPSTSLHVMTFNIDGLNEESLPERTAKVVELLRGDEAHRPDVIMLQEVVPQTAPAIISELVDIGYVCAPPDLPTAPYFTLLFIKPERITLKTQKRKAFPCGSRMDRDLVEVAGVLDGKVDVCFLTSHLESLKDGSRLRVSQLNTVIDTLTAFKGLAIYGGDTNLREAEVKSNPKYKTVTDAWEAVGSPADKKFTWDLQINTNLQMPGANQPRMRLDRVLFNKHVAKVEVEALSLVGTQRLSGGSTGPFPSDHFGISCRLKVPLP